MDWREINCVIDALEALVAKHQRRLATEHLNDDQRSDLGNDLAYAEILLGTYRERRDDLRP